MDVLLEDRFDLVDLKLGLEGLWVGGQAAAVGSTAGIGKVKALEDYFATGFTPEMATRLASVCDYGIREDWGHDSIG